VASARTAGFGLVKAKGSALGCGLWLFPVQTIGTGPAGTLAAVDTAAVDEAEPGFARPVKLLDLGLIPVRCCNWRGQ
jgi:hypothetical protein